MVQKENLSPLRREKFKCTTLGTSFCNTFTLTLSCHGCRAWHERYNHPTIASPVIKDNDHKPLKSIIFKSFSRAPRRLLITPLKLQYRKSVKRHAYKKEVQVSTSRSYLSLHLSPVKAVLRPLWIISALSSVFLFPSLWTLEFKRKRFIFCQEIS